MRRYQDPGVSGGWILDNPFDRGDVTHCGSTACRSTHRVPVHVHSGLEIMYLVSGEVAWSIGGSIVRQGAGEVLVVGDGTPHGTAPRRHPPFRALFVGLDAQTSGGRGGELRAMLDRAGGSLAPFAAPEFEPVLEGLYRIAGDGLHTSGAVAAPFHELLVRLVGERLVGQRMAVSPEVQAVVVYLRANLDRRLGVPAMARIASLSVRRFSTRFRNELGTSPAAWHLGERLAGAMSALRTPGGSIKTVAQDFGFSSAQHFSTAFKRTLGASPGRYRSPMWPPTG